MKEKLIEDLASLKQSLHTMRLTNDITLIGKKSMEAGIDAMIEVVKKINNAQNPMTPNEKRLAAKMLDLAADEFSNHGCNDVEDSMYDGWTLEERQQFVKEYHQWNGDPEEFDERFLYIGDDTIMRYLAHKLEQEAASK